MKLDQSMTLTLIVLLSVTIVSSVATLNAQKQSGSSTPSQNSVSQNERKQLEQDARFPLVDFETSESNDIEQRAKRKLKSKRYNKSSLVSKEAPSYINETALDSQWHEGIPALPITESDAVVIGHVLSATAHLSEDATGIYSEFNLQIDEVMKSNIGITSGNVVSVERTGGIVRYPNGHKILYRIIGMNMPAPNKKYLLFLNSTEQSENYQILTAYELTKNGVSALDTPEQFAIYNGTSEANFLEVLRASITQSLQSTK